MFKKFITKITSPFVKGGPRGILPAANTNYDQLTCATPTCKATEYPSWLHGRILERNVILYQSEAYTGDIDTVFTITTTLN